MSECHLHNLNFRNKPCKIYRIQYTTKVRPPQTLVRGWQSADAGLHPPGHLLDLHLPQPGRVQADEGQPVPRVLRRLQLFDNSRCWQVKWRSRCKDTRSLISPLINSDHVMKVCCHFLPDEAPDVTIPEVPNWPHPRQLAGWYIIHYLLLFLAVSLCNTVLPIKAGKPRLRSRRDLFGF